MNGFVPWSVPAFAGIVAGIVAASALDPFAATILSLASATAGGAAIARSSVVRVRTLAIAALCLPVGAARELQHASWQDPIAPLGGSYVEVTGRSDGRFLHLSGVDARVALRAASEVPRGTVRVRGRMRPARPARTPGGFDERGWLRVHRASQLLEVDRFTVVRSESPARRRARAELTHGLGDEAATLLRAMVLGERDGAGALRERFAQAGLAHLLALSGLHLGIVAAALGALLAPLGRGRGVVVAGVALLVPFLLGPSPSLIRAATMTAVVALAVGQGSGRVGPVAALGVAGAASLVMRPAWLADVGFQLSYLSLAGILAWGVPATRWLASGRARSDPRLWIASSLAVSVSAWLAGLPRVASVFGTVALAGPLANLVAIPLAGLLVSGGAATAALGVIGVSVGRVSSLFLAPAAEALLFVAGLAAQLPRWSAPSIGTAGTVLFALAVMPWAWTVRDRFAARRALLVSVFALASWSLLPEPGPLPELLILDVGQGDASLLRLPGRVAVLVDGGGTPFGDFDVGAEVVVPALRSLGVDALDLVVLSHADLDHAEGLTSVLRAIPVGALAFGHEAPGSVAWDRLIATAEAEGVPLIPLRRGQRLNFGDATLHVVHPGAKASGEANRDSVVLRIDWRARPWALLAGDVPREVERTLAIPRLPLLLAPHHGSASSTGAELLRAARPETVAISVGRNRYGHPDGTVLTRLAQAGTRVLRTDQNGTLRFSPSW